MNTLTKLYIVRHAESEANVKKTLGATAEVNITELGKEQASHLAQKLKHIHFDAIFSSDLVRAKQTAEILAMERDFAVKTATVLRERHYGRMDGKTEDEIKEELKDLYDAYQRLPNEEKYRSKFVDDMETAEEAMQRFITYLREIAIAYEGKTILVVSHTSLMRSFLVHLGFSTHNEIKRFPVKNTGYILVESDGVDFFLRDTYLTEK